MTERNAEPTILAIDDDEMLLEAMGRSLRAHGFAMLTASSAGDGFAVLAAHVGAIRTVLLDIDLGLENGIEVLASIRATYPHIPVVMLTGDARAQTAVAALRLGAHNFINKPVRDYAAFAAVLRSAVSYGDLQARLTELEAAMADDDPTFVGRSDRFLELKSTIARIAPLDVNVLITGESGTGKELVARRLHEGSPRASKPFVALNCAAYPETLIDAELFGHERGAFTGAASARAGLFERAKGGTVFLDEIGDIKPDVQIRLLRVLQEREVRRLGSDQAIPIDARVVAATLVDLEEAVEDKSFRADLYYRLNVVRLYMPRLRERTGDVELLIAHALEKHAKRQGRDIPTLEPQALESLLRYPWPGNVRELENVIQGVIATVPGDSISWAHLPPQIKEAKPRIITQRSAETSWQGEIDFRRAKANALDDFHRRYFDQLLRETSGNLSDAARRAGIDRSNLRRVLNRYSIDPEPYRDATDS